jgi:hypothetical protein
MVTHMIPFGVIALREYLDRDGRSPFGRWLDALDAQAAAKVTVALARIEQGDSLA